MEMLSALRHITVYCQGILAVETEKAVQKVNILRAPIRIRNTALVMVDLTGRFW